MKGKHPTQQLSMRMLEAAGALAALILLSPLLAIATLLILVGDGLPILFRQTRIGKNGELFLILKFRTMRKGCGGLAITAPGDSRVTSVGAWLRKFKIDELPQLINVLQGDMSLIGPRPEVPEYVEHTDDRWRKVLEVRPGITDLASLAFRNEDAILGPAVNPDAYYRSVILPEKLRLNLQYQRSRSAPRDLKLLWMTARYSFFPQGFDRDRIIRSFGAEIPRGANHSLPVADGQARLIQSEQT
jgi:lipopolysaccharide/colanic/teichoic acid biosynthesis glycosyltransferase